MRLPLLGLAVLAAFALPVAASAAGQGGITARLIAAPGASSKDPLARVAVVAKLAAGTTISRTVEISNTTASPAALTVYPAAASNVSGRFAFAAGHTQNELSSWIHVSDPALRLLPRERATETVTIAMPKGATVGERTAVVWTEIRATASTGVELVNRVGVRVYLLDGAGALDTPSTTPTPSPPAVGHSFWSAHLLQILAAIVLLLVGAVALTGFGIVRDHHRPHLG
jgi:hypothetical protein